MPSRGRRISTAPAPAWWTAWSCWPRCSIPAGLGIVSRTERAGSHDPLVGWNPVTMTSQEAQAYCTALAKRSGSNFYYSFFFLPPDRRDAMHAVYAFCREVDSVVDEPEPGSNPHDRLARWREELAGQYRTERNTVSPPVEVLSPVMTCLGGHIRRLGIPREYFDDIIAGVAMDLTIKRYATFRDLYQYCYRVASAVGLVCLKIFGARAPKPPPARWCPPKSCGRSITPSWNASKPAATGCSAGASRSRLRTA